MNSYAYKPVGRIYYCDFKTDLQYSNFTSTTEAPLEEPVQDETDLQNSFEIPITFNSVTDLAFTQDTQDELNFYAYNHPNGTLPRDIEVTIQTFHSTLSHVFWTLNGTGIALRDFYGHLYPAYFDGHCFNYYSPETQAIFKGERTYLFVKGINTVTTIERNSGRASGIYKENVTHHYLGWPQNWTNTFSLIKTPGHRMHVRILRTNEDQFFSCSYRIGFIIPAKDITQLPTTVITNTNQYPPLRLPEGRAYDEPQILPKNFTPNHQNLRLYKRKYSNYLEQYTCYSCQLDRRRQFDLSTEIST